MNYYDALLYIFPEIAITIGICAVLGWEMFARNKQSWESPVLALGFLAIAGYLLVQRLEPRVFPGYLDYPAQTVFGMVYVDHFATIFKLFITTAVAVVIGFDVFDRRQSREGKGEIYFLLLTAVLGSYFLVGTTNVALLYLGLETLGLASYALAGMHKRDRGSAEASLKYVVYGALASGILLFGISLLYGLTGTLEMRAMIGEISEAIRAGRSIQVALPALLALVGFGFKLSLFPFHWWAPDVYQGVPTPIATFLAVGSKGVALAAFLRFMAILFGGLIPDPALAEPVDPAFPEFLASLGGTLALVAAVTMVFGNLAALRQTNLKRLLAYSSIAHAGYILVGVAAFTQEGFQAAVLYTFVYYFMNLGAFGVVIYFANQTGSEEIGSLKGLGFRHPVAGIAAVVFLASLTGLPPTAGFAGKWVLLKVAWEGGLQWLALLVALMSVVSLFFYFRIAKELFLRDPDQALVPVKSHVLAGMLAVLAICSVVFVDFEPLMDLAVAAVSGGYAGTAFEAQDSLFYFRPFVLQQ